MSAGDIYEVVIVGGGTAGSNAARAARRAGAKRVLLIHLPDLINTCAEMGCMPSKSLITASERGVPFPKAVALMDTHIRRLRAGLLEGFAEGDFEVMTGSASFLPDGSGIEVREGDTATRVAGKRYVIATGSESVMPPIKGLGALPEERYFTSNGLVSEKHIRNLPQSVFILGGGPIGLEMMTALTHFGVAVTIAERAPHLLSRMDPEFGLEMEKAIAMNPKATLLTDASLLEVCEAGSELLCIVERDGKEERHRSEKLLLAVGRRPCLDNLGLEHIGVDRDERGGIIYDEATLETSNPNIYVAGDMTGRNQILHYAAAMGRVAGANAVHGAPKERMDYEKNNMGVIFSDPQVGHAGMTETAAREAHLESVSATIDLPNIGRGLLEDRKVGLWKLTAEKESGKIIGGQAISAMPHSEWFADTVSWLLHFGGTAHDVAEKVPYYHPTYPELFQTLGRELVEKLNA